MALPTSRNRTYAPGSQLFSADLNDLQDCIVADKHGARWQFFTAGRGVQEVNVAFDQPTVGTFNGGLRATGATTYVMPLSLPVGTRISNMKVRQRGITGGGSSTYKLSLVTRSVPNPSDIFQATVPDPGNGVFVDHTAAAIVTPTTIADGDTLIFTAGMATLNQWMQHFALELSRP